MTTTTDVPGKLPCAIDGHGYLIEPDYQRATVPVMRQQSDQSTEPGEQSLNPQGLWRRSQESWHHGAGQTFLDGKDEQAADPHRFRSSKGVDVWTKGQVSLLHPTLKSRTSANSNLFLTGILNSVGSISYLCLADGTEVYYNAMPFGLVTQVTGWTATNATIAVPPPSGHPGWMRVTATASAAVSLTSPTGLSGVLVDPARPYVMTVQSANVSGSGGKIPQIAINWYDAAGALISSSSPTAAPGNDSPSNGVNANATPPANAAYAGVTVSYTANWTNGDVHDVAATIAPVDDVGVALAGDIWVPVDINAGQAAQTVQALASTGSYIWAALGTSGLHRWRVGFGAATADVPAAPGGGQISLVGYANGFLLAAGSDSSTTGQNKLWLVNTPTGAATLSTINVGSAAEHPNPGFIWTGFASGRNVIYAYGNSGGTGEIFKITYDQNTGTLSTAASPATSWVDGETIHALTYYAGGVILGTGKGVRLGQVDGAGNIDYGPLIPTTWPVKCLEPQDRYCWFGWTKYDATNSGLGRIDLGWMTDTLTPAWASDLMTPLTSSGDVVSVVTFSPYGYTATQRPPVRVFTVAGSGVYIEDPGSRVSSGDLESGTIRFSTSESKTTRSVDIRHHALQAGGSVAVEQQRDTSGTWTSLGSSSTAGSYGPATPIDAGSLSAEALEYRFTLTRPTPSGPNYTGSPELTRWTAKVLPTPSTIDETFTLTLVMKERIQTTAGDGQPHYQDVPAEVAFLKGLERSRQIVNFQLGSETFEGFVVASEFKGEHWNNPKREFAEGLMQVQLQTARG